jgi:uncharacterized protein YdiU (UPF0061 family)
VFPELGDGFFDEVDAARFPKHVLRFRNQKWAERIGLGALDGAAWEAHFASFAPLEANLEKPLALRYHGHQFGVYNPALGDGRGFLFAQLRDDDGRLMDLGTKGSGQTPWSRGGDGRLTLKGGVREVLATEMLEALGVPTSKSLSLFETGESLMRGDEPSPTRASVLVRLGHSHIRFGTFQRFAHAKDTARVKRLLDHVVHYYMPDLASAAEPDLPLAFLRLVTRKSAELCAAWTVAGFVHGVLNTDNMNINGESFDYGPWRFLPKYDPDFVAAYFDHSGLYAFGKQPSAVLWNVSRLAECLRPLSPSAPLASVLDEFEPAFDRAVSAGLARRLGLTPLGDDVDLLLAPRVFAFLEESGVSYDRFFFDWFGGFASEKRAVESSVTRAYRGDRFAAFLELLEVYAPRNVALLANPYFQNPAPESLLIGEVEEIWARIAEADDWSAFEAKVSDIRAMGAATLPSRGAPSVDANGAVLLESIGS